MNKMKLVKILINRLIKILNFKLLPLFQKICVNQWDWPQKRENKVCLIIINNKMKNN